MRRGAAAGVLRIAICAALICVTLFSLAASYNFSDLNKSLRMQIDVLNGLLTRQQAEISRLNDMIAKDANLTEGSSAELPAPAGEETLPDVTGVWEPAPPKLWSEHKYYHELYPSLYTARPERRFTRDKTVYLTFDDGPTIYTERVLDILNEEGVEGSFFVVGNSVARLGEIGEALLSRMADEGHTIGVHCNVHVYNQVYASIEAFLEDFNAAYTLIREVTGVSADIFRFPGGSVNNYNSKIRTDLIDEMTRRGFTYYDWNASTGDTSGNVTEDSAWRNATVHAGKVNRVIILMHDTREAAVRALPRIIDTYRSMGYSFAKLTNIDKPIEL
ncbi:MAG: polysaccharide deacetylase [Clostridiales Family XIII bacterium]|jgi:peptidoglycan/xylan/chitin deacetylase (PgdA/CDA1 family)|nr:polysaccharide deacetylase [Clostridiales Family XIII bacterium]